LVLKIAETTSDFCQKTAKKFPEFEQPQLNLFEKHEFSNSMKAISISIDKYTALKEKETNFSRLRSNKTIDTNVQPKEICQTASNFNQKYYYSPESEKIEVRKMNLSQSR
jgi:hypothetical protein